MHDLWVDSGWALILLAKYAIYVTRIFHYYYTYLTDVAHRRPLRGRTCLHVDMAGSIMTEINFTKSLRSYKPKTCKVRAPLITTTVVLSLHVRNCGLMEPLKLCLEQWLFSKDFNSKTNCETSHRCQCDHTSLHSKALCYAPFYA